VKFTGSLLKDKSLAKPTAIGGVCSGGIPTRPGDSHYPTTTTDPMHPIAVAMSLYGNASCASGAAAIAADGNRVKHWPESGKATFTMQETYVDPATLLTKHYTALADFVVTGFDPAGPDVVDISGVITKGVGIGGIVSGSLWQDPVVLAAKGTPATSTAYNTGYDLDGPNALKCLDGTAGNAAVSMVMFGGGGGSAISPAGNSATGIQIEIPNS
jgi:hypothetical protein